MVDTSINALRASLRKLVETGAIGEFDFTKNPRHVLSAQWRYSHTEPWYTLGFSVPWTVDDIESWTRDTVESGELYGRALVARTIVFVDHLNAYAVWSIYGDVTVADYRIERGA